MISVKNHDRCLLLTFFVYGCNIKDNDYIFHKLGCTSTKSRLSECKERKKRAETSAKEKGGRLFLSLPSVSDLPCRAIKNK